MKDLPESFEGVADILILSFSIGEMRCSVFDFLEFNNNLIPLSF